MHICVLHTRGWVPVHVGSTMEWIAIYCLTAVWMILLTVVVMFNVCYSIKEIKKLQEKLDQFLGPQAEQAPSDRESSEEPNEGEVQSWQNGVN